jgi:hypothetical protein
MRETTQRYWNEIRKGDVIVRKDQEDATVVSTDVRQSVNVVKLGNGEYLWVYRHGPGSVITVAALGEEGA